jgi:hypothetical protein
MGRQSKIAFAAVVALVALVIGAISAWATATANKAEWYTGPKESSVATLVGKGSLTASASGKIQLEFPIAGLPIKIWANAAGCVECTITNEAFGHSGVATGTGKLVFSEATFPEVSACKLKENKITSELLLFEANYAEGERWLLKISPVAGETDLTLNIEAAKPPTICPFEGSGTPVKGATFGEFKAKSGTFALEQSVVFSPAISEAAGSHWTFGPEPFSITGVLVIKAGGSYFGVK